MRMVGGPIGTHELVRGRQEQCREELFQLLVERVERYDIGGIVVGFPLRMDGKEGKACRTVKDFVALMQVPATNRKVLISFVTQMCAFAPRAITIHSKKYQW